MTTPEIIAPAPDAPLTFEAPAPVAPGVPNPIPNPPWGQPITPATTAATPTETV